MKVAWPQLTWHALYRAPDQASGSFAGTALYTRLGGREENQDRVLSLLWREGDAVLRLALVADGIGGGRGGVYGGDAAAVAAGAMVSRLVGNPERLGTVHLRLVDALYEANRQVHRDFCGEGGCTLSAVLQGGADTGWVHVGDSRIYRTYGHPGDVQSLEALTTDDTLNQPGRHSVLTQYVGKGDAMVHQAGRVPPTASRLLLLTDGMPLGSEELLRKVLANAPTPQDALDRLAEIAAWTGGKDNASGVVFDLADPDCLPRDGEHQLFTLDPSGEPKVWSPNPALGHWLEIEPEVDEDITEELAP